MARIAWFAVAIASVALFTVSLPAFYADLLTLHYPSIIRDQETVRAGFEQLGMAVAAYANFILAVSVALAAAFMGTGLVIFLRSRGQRAALFVSFTLVVSGAMWPNTLGGLASVHALLGSAGALLSGLGFTCFFLLFYLFPDGRFVPAWTRWFALALILSMAVITVFPDSQLNKGMLELAQILVFPGTMLVAQVYRYRRVSGPAQRQQTKWATYGLLVAIMTFIGTGLLAGIPAFQQPVPAALLVFAVPAVLVLAFMVVPVSIGLAVMRSRLWDIDPIVNRTLVYGALTASIVGIYVLVVGWLGIVVRSGDNRLVSLAGAGLVAVVFQPLREALQRGVNRLMYGERDEPYRILSRLGQRLEATLAPDTVLPTIVGTVRDALKLPYAAIALKRGDGLPIVAAKGEPIPRPLRLPLVYQQETVGEFLLAPRDVGEEFSPADRRLLDDLARQAGIAAHAVRLAADLQYARERLVTAREEERRRLRRDLHDGLGSQLAAINLQAGALRRLIPLDPAAAEEALTELRTEIRSAIGDIRRLAYGLRPPALDDLGLAQAIRQRAEQCYVNAKSEDSQTAEEQQELRIIVDVPEQLPHMSAAVEVAAYRIAEEALTNVVRHARARNCWIRIATDEELLLEVSDDGIGIPTNRVAGVGLISMRERAEELGGTSVVERGPERGTRVLVRLPLARE